MSRPSTQRATSAVISLISRGAVSIDSRVWTMRMVGSPREQIWRSGSPSATPADGLSSPHIAGENPMRSALAAAAVLPLIAFGGSARAQNTDLLLVLAADVSRSIDDAEFDLQRKGYTAALTDSRVLAAIRGGSTGSIAVCFVEWSGAGEQMVVADWAVIHDDEDAGALAAAILTQPRSFVGRTSISGAIDFAMERFAAAKPQSNRRIIDIS